MVEYATFKNNVVDKPNEDYIYVDENNGLYILLDGVTRDRENGRYPSPSPAEKVNKVFAKRLIKEFERSDYDVSSADEMKNYINAANEEVFSFNSRLSHRFPAGTVGIILKSIEDSLLYAYIGDCYGAAISNNSMTYFTNPQTNNIMLHKSEFTSDQIRFDICNNPDHPYSYGVWNGDVRAKDFVVTGKIDLYGKQAVLLYSDGAHDMLKNKAAADLCAAPVDELIREESPSYMDDRSIIRLSLSV